MGGLPLGLMEELVAERRAELAAGAGSRRRAASSPRRRGGGRRRAPARVAGRVLVAAGVRLAGPEALRRVGEVWATAAGSGQAPA